MRMQILTTYLKFFQEQTTLGRLRGSGHDDHQMTDVKFEYEQPSVPASAYIPDVGHMVPGISLIYSQKGIHIIN